MSIKPLIYLCKSIENTKGEVQWRVQRVMTYTLQVWGQKCILCDRIEGVSHHLGLVCIRWLLLFVKHMLFYEAHIGCYLGNCWLIFDDTHQSPTAWPPQNGTHLKVSLKGGSGFDAPPHCRCQQWCRSSAWPTWAAVWLEDGSSLESLGERGGGSPSPVSSFRTPVRTHTHTHHTTHTH